MAVTIVGLSFLVVGVPFIWIALRVFARDRAIARWPRTPGVVTSAKLKTSTHRITDQNTGLDSYGTYYEPTVSYTYTVGGQTFDGKSIARSLDGLVTTHKAAKRITDKYPPEKQVDVLYDPANPRMAHLETRRSVGAIILFAFGVFWLALGSLLLALSLT